jgi:Tol biopolymer transport system component
MYVIQAAIDHYSQYIANCQAPSFSRDGSQILCVSPDSRIILVNVSDGSFIKQINQSKWAGLVDISKTNDDIVFTVRDGEKTQIWKTSFTGEDTIMLAGDASENYAPVWSPDGNYIAYQSNEGSGNSEIWVMDSSGNNKQRITTTPDGSWSRGPSWSPDGNFLAYVSNQNGSIDSDTGEVFVVSLVSEEIHQITNTGGKVYDWKVAWGN